MKKLGLFCLRCFLGFLVIWAVRNGDRYFAAWGKERSAAGAWVRRGYWGGTGTGTRTRTRTKRKMIM